MIEKKHNLIYQITNLVNGKIYIGRHITNKVDDGYMGSGNEIQKAQSKYGIENFQREILFDFNNAQDMIDKENELLSEEFVKRKDVYNIVVGGSSGMIGKTHDERVRQILREANTGLVSVKDKDGNNLKVTKDDPRYISGELKHNTHGTICVKDSEGNKFRVPFDDPRWLSGELVGMNTGDKQTPERIQNRVEKNLEWWKENSHSEEGLQKMRDVNKGKVNVRDKDGNEFRIDKNDPRIKSGELINACKGSVWVHNNDLQKSRFVRPEKVQEFLNDGWEFGLVYFNKKTVRITNPELRRNDWVPPDQLKEYCKDGWVVGYQYYSNNRSEKSEPKSKTEVKAVSIKDGKWMHNPKTDHKRIIPEKLFDEYLENGWKFGKKVLKLHI